MYTRKFWGRKPYQPTEEEAYYFIKDMLREYGDDDFYARGSGSRGNSYRRGGSSYHEDKEAKIEALKDVYYSLCSFFKEIGVNPDEEN